QFRRLLRRRFGRDRIVVLVLAVEHFDDSHATRQQMPMTVDCFETIPAGLADGLDERLEGSCERQLERTTSVAIDDHLRPSRSARQLADAPRRGLYGHVDRISVSVVGEWKLAV